MQLLCKIITAEKWQYFKSSYISVVLLITSYSEKQFFHFSPKSGSKNNKITVAEGGRVLTDAKIAETFNSIFGNIVNTLNIEKDEGIFCDM